MTPTELFDRLLSLERFGIRPGLERIEALLDGVGHPERAFPILHVGGTNGKGSVSAIAEAILRAAGYRPGLYTSPHLLDVTERIRIDGVPLASDALARYVGMLDAQLDAGGFTFFEAMTAVGLAAFRDAGVGVAIVEVGLGGRWDATNVGAPLVSVITRIDYDHQDYLGARLEEIAAEKAAIIRGGIALSAAQPPEALGLVRAHCLTVGVPLLVEGQDLRVEVVRSDLGGHRIHLAGPGWAVRDLDLALPGLFQPANAALAVGAVRAFADTTGLSVPESAIRTGCHEVRWPGRFQVIPPDQDRPMLVLDGAHNPAGAAALAGSLAHYFPEARLALVVGVSADKDRAGILKALAARADRLILTAANHPRATPPPVLAEEMPPVEAEVTLVDEVGPALGLALADPSADVVCVAGSLFLVGDALRWLDAHGIR